VSPSSPGTAGLWWGWWCLNIKNPTLMARVGAINTGSAVRIGGMQWYACKFCIALHGIPPGGRNALPTDRAQVEAHVCEVHDYPAHSAEYILRDRRDGKLTAELIENSGPVVTVLPAEDL
jgi:hypothetical protein